MFLIIENYSLKQEHNQRDLKILHRKSWKRILEENDQFRELKYGQFDIISLDS